MNQATSPHDHNLTPASRMALIDDPFKIPKKLLSKKPSIPEDYPKPLVPLQIEAGLEPYAEPLDTARLKHLLRRTGFGASATAIEANLGRMAADVVGNMVAEATDPSLLPLPEVPDWIDTPIPDRNTSPAEFEQYVTNNGIWFDELRAGWFEWMHKGGLREKMTFFWHNHFVTEIGAYNLATLAYRYVSLLREHSLGNFKDFVRVIGLTPAMLIYLNGNANEKSAPNENYSRELLELFTMSPQDRLGNPNYTQEDIEEIARALTGWVVDFANYSSIFIGSRFDTGEKTFFGRTGGFGYDDVIDILFEERASETAYFICWNLYREFVYEVPDDDIVQGLAGIFLSNNFELAPVVTALLQSAHFFDAQVIGARIQSPVELITGMFVDVEFTPSADTFAILPRAGDILDQAMFNPPNVAGWEGHRNWISTTTLPLRWLVTDFLLYSGNDQEPIDLVPFAQTFVEAGDPLAAFRLPLAIAEKLITVPLDELDIGEVPEDFGGDLITFPIPEEILNSPPYTLNLAKIFLAGIPWYEWALEADGANFILLNFVRYLAQLPEFHLT